MKQLVKVKQAEEQPGIEKQQGAVNENHLYNLLFAGKISLKEYLNKVKEKELQHQAA